MAQQKPEEKTTLDQVLRLVSQLTLEEQQILSEEFSKLKELRRRCAEVEASLDRGEGIPDEVVLEELRQRAEERLRKSQS
jgi:translation initiation factor IF-2